MGGQISQEIRSLNYSSATGVYKPGYKKISVNLMVAKDGSNIMLHVDFRPVEKRVSIVNFFDITPNDEK